MSAPAPARFDAVALDTKANVYFDGKVVSHTFHTPDGARRTLGLVFPGTFHFGTGAPELMQVVAGTMRVRLDGEADFTTYAAGTWFRVPGDSSFDITVDAGVAEYVCTFG
jgi:uncharacterized protein YaiE (UPF0345 family)